MSQIRASYLIIQHKNVVLRNGGWYYPGFRLGGLYVFTKSIMRLRPPHTTFDLAGIAVVLSSRAFSLLQSCMHSMSL
jgi:hypothetical protein